MYEGWISLGGLEIANNERYAANAAALCLPAPHTAVRCPDLARVLADTYDGDVTAAPWYDAAAPESAAFAGLFVTSVTGLGASTRSREVVPAPAGPAIARPATAAPRVMLVTAYAAAASHAGLRYGLAWLASALGDACESGGCDPGATLCMLAEAPVCPAPADADACWETLLRTLHDVATVDGPRITAEYDVAGGAAAQVEFTLTAAVPGIYRAPAAITSGLAFTPPAPLSACAVTWVPHTTTCPEPASCAPAGGCLTDPAAPPVYAPPAAARAPGPCLLRLHSATALATAAPNLIPRWLEAVPVLHLTTGDAPMRRLTVRFHSSPDTTITDPAAFDPCSALLELNVTYLPRDVTLVLDGRTEQAYVICPGGARESADTVLFGEDGAPFTWPAIACGTGLQVAVFTDAGHYSTAARLDVALAARQDVA